MTLHLAISPDVNVRNATDWFIFNTSLQRILGQGVRATMYDDFEELHRAFERGEADIVFANAANTATLVRDHGYRPVAAPAEHSNEAAIVVAADYAAQEVKDLPPAIRAVATDTPDVERICRILLEPADLTPETIELSIKPNPVIVAKSVLRGEAEVGFLPKAAFDEFSSVVARQLRVLVSSKIYVVRHSLLVSPALAEQVDALFAGLTAMHETPQGRELLVALGAPNGFERLSQEDAEFMIDLMDALAQQ